MQKVLSLTNKYIILATPLILYSLLINIYLVATTSSGKIINLIIAGIMFFFMTSAFLSGWFNMIKIAVSTPEREDTNSLIKEFIPGVGEFFLSTSGGLLFALLIMVLMLVITYLIGTNFVGSPEISVNDLSKAMQSQTTLKAFVNGLSIEQLNKLFLWNILTIISMSFGYFLIFLHMPAIFFENKNPFKAFIISLKKIFSKHFISITGVFLLIFVLNFFISIFSAILGSNLIGHFIITLLNIYFITAVGVGIFYYYYNQFIDSKIGQNVDIEI